MSDPAALRCPFCTNTDPTLLERIGAQWFVCLVCSKDFGQRPTDRAGVVITKTFDRKTAAGG